MRVCLFEDRHADQLEPLSLTRPVYELLCGRTSLGARQWRHFTPCTSTGVLVRTHLEDVQKSQRADVAVNDMTWLRSELTVLVNARWLPPSGTIGDLSSPCVGLVDDEVAFAVVHPELLTYCSPDTINDCVEVWKRTLVRRAAGGSVVRHLWELVDRNGPQLNADFDDLKNVPWGVTGASVAVVGPRERLLVDPTARLDPHIVADTTNGPVIIEADAVVSAFTRLEGPCCIGSGTHVLGAKIRAGTTLGPHCRIGGEVEASIVQGYSNKYHEGFLGHSYVGSWVNLGAGTHNSDLRNDYGPVTVTVGGRRLDTGRTKIGCYLGDHTKSGLGALLNTGTTAGVFANLLPCGGLLPKYVPSFCSVWNGALVESASLASLLETARTVMQRRGWELTPSLAALYEQLHERTALERQRGLREVEQRRLRRTA